MNVTPVPEYAGWLKLYRKLLGSEVWCNEGLLKVWLWCLLKAAHKPTAVMVSCGRYSKRVELKPGQFIFGRDTAAGEIGMKPSNVRNRMARLQKLGNVDMQTDTHFTVVTVCNWQTYQESGNADGQAKGQGEDSGRTAVGQRVDTNNNYKEHEECTNNWRLWHDRITSFRCITRKGL